jgi:chromosome segregation ATPase
MLESSDLDRLRQLVGAVSADEEPGAEVDRLESAVSRRDVARQGLCRQIEHLRDRIAGMEMEVGTIDGEVLGLERALEALYRDIAEHRGLDFTQ